MSRGLANIILIIGQSNAVSRGTLGVPYPGDWTPLMYGDRWSEGTWTGDWVQYIPGSHQLPEHGAMSHGDRKRQSALCKRGLHVS